MHLAHPNSKACYKNRSDGSHALPRDRHQPFVRPYKRPCGGDLRTAIRRCVHFKRPKERAFVSSERPHTTILFGGLTFAHEHILKGAVLGLGYRVEHLPCPDNEALRLGKEYCNRGQCNPTYYTVGNLIRYLQKLEYAGMSADEIVEKYVFLTAGSCGPCRFGMYEAEYRQALSAAGFGGFRVLVFQQSGGMNQADEKEGVRLKTKFFVAVLKALLVGDLLNEIGRKIRPYEIRKGHTVEVMSQALKTASDALRNRTSLLVALRRIRKLFGQIEVGFSGLKPRVKIIGEFWAQTTEGDGSYHLAQWLEEEGAETVVEPVSVWIQYLMWSAGRAAADRAKIQCGRWWLVARLVLARTIFGIVHEIYRAALGFKPDRPSSMHMLARCADPYFNTRLTGGEGHLEVGKTIVSRLQKKADMVVSLKPFGCMPSTQSDGVQMKAVADYGCIFLPVETSGDSDVNVKSRVQMMLYEAKQKASQELKEVEVEHGLATEQVGTDSGEVSETQGSISAAGWCEAVSRATNFVRHVKRHIGLFSGVT